MKKVLKLSFIFIITIFITGIIYAYPEYKSIKKSNKSIEKCVPENGFIGIMPHAEIPFYLKFFGIKYEYQKCCSGLKASHNNDILAPQDVIKCKKEN
jgi:hypothetical protein